MNGLDKIIAQILDDAKQESLAIQEKAASGSGDDPCGSR